MQVTIKSSIKGFRRAGMAHSNESVSHPDGTFTAAQIKQLQAEPRLTVTIKGDASATTDSSNSNSNPQGTVDAERIRGLVEHIASLDKENAALWKQDQTPKADAFPKGTTAEERAAAWEAFLESIENADQDGAAGTESTDQKTDME
ncbi:MAG: HI1506-related protein [Marinomonas foliarum]|uniref:HI1506-related protein n=1 Tax=Marinomonas foliarum TaxID=491950 RepID=UPI003F96722B